MLISNTLRTFDERHKMGHWVVFYIDGRVLFFLDSFGLEPSIYCHEFASFINKHNHLKRYSLKRPLQPLASITCGLFAFFFVHFISHHNLLKCLRYSQLKFSTRHKSLNDTFVKKYFIKSVKGDSCHMWKLDDQKAMSYKECQSLLLKSTKEKK